jgi:hypothetical protein
MAEETSPTTREILGGLRPSQLWTLGSSIVALLLGSFWLGIFIEKTRSETVILNKEKSIAELQADHRTFSEAKDKELSTLKDEIATHKRAMQFASDKLNELNSQYSALEAKAEFLNRFNSYLSDPNGSSKNYLLIMFVYYGEILRNADLVLIVKVLIFP